MNKVILIGRMTADPSLKFTPGNGTAVCNFTLAVDRRFKKEGQQEADFIPIVVWGKIAESTANYMSKGSQVAISGRLQISSYQDKEGNTKYRTDVVADEVQFLSSKNNTQSIQNTDFGVPVQTDDENSVTPVDDGDIPFS